MCELLWRGAQRDQVHEPGVVGGWSPAVRAPKSGAFSIKPATAAKRSATVKGSDLVRFDLITLFICVGWFSDSNSSNTIYLPRPAKR